ncbi:MAG: hypothetical protein ACR2OA_09830 [Rubripirellula sp.]|jgi:hypothetical protein
MDATSKNLHMMMVLGAQAVAAASPVLAGSFVSCLALLGGDVTLRKDASRAVRVSSLVLLSVRAIQTQ